MPMFLPVVITFPEFVAVLSVHESSSSPALAEQTLGVLSFGFLATGGGSYTSSEEVEEEVLLHFLVTEPAIVGSYPTTALEMQ